MIFVQYLSSSHAHPSNNNNNNKSHMIHILLIDKRYYK